jgi:hypothetical protein
LSALLDDGNSFYTVNERERERERERGLKKREIRSALRFTGLQKE